MRKKEELVSFIKHVEELTEKLFDQSMEYTDKKLKKIEQVDISITLDNKTVKIPFNADSYEPLINLIQQEIEYIDEK